MAQERRLPWWKPFFLAHGPFYSLRGYPSTFRRHFLLPPPAPPGGTEGRSPQTPWVGLRPPISCSTSKNYSITGRQNGLFVPEPPSWMPEATASTYQVLRRKGNRPNPSFSPTSSVPEERESPESFLFTHLQCSRRKEIARILLFNKPRI